MVPSMAMSFEQVRMGFRDGTIMFCLPAVHADFTDEFLERFSERILRRSWYDLADRAHLKISALVANPETEQELADAIQFEYGADVSDLHGMSLWAVIRRCAEQSRNRRVGC